MEHESHWDLLPNDMLVVVLAYLSGKEIGRLATVSKQFYVCTSENSLWKRKFMEDYDQRIVTKMAGRAAEAEQAFLELLQPDHPEHYVLTDWKSGYVMKVINNTTHERLQCFSNCLANIRDGFTMLNGHDLPRCMLMPRLIEPILPLKIDRVFSRREVRDKSQPIEQYKNEKGTQLFKKIMAESMPEQLTWKYLLVNGAKHPEILSQLLKSNAPSISLLGKWFNSTNSRNFPFVVKFDADLALTEWLFTYCYERSAIVLVSVAPTIVDYVANQWYLQPYDSTTALLVCLKNHFARWFKLCDEKSFCWIYDAVTLYSVCRAFDAKQAEKLFYTVLVNGSGEVTTREPVIDSFLVFGNEFYVGELPHETVLLQRDQPLSECANLPGDTAEARLKGMTHYKQYRQAYQHGAQQLGVKLSTLATQEERHAYLNRVAKVLHQYHAINYAPEFYQLAGEFGEFWENEECKAVLANAVFNKSVLDDLKAKLLSSLQ